MMPPRKKTTQPEITPETILAVEQPSYSIEQTAQRWQNLFSSGYSSNDFLQAFGGVLGRNPYVQNQRLKRLKSLPIFMDRDTLEQALQSPEYSEQTLREASWALSTIAYPLYKLMRLYSDMLTYKHYAHPKYVDKADLKTPRFKSDSKLVHMFLDKLQPQYTFRRIALEVAREGKRAYCLRLDADNKTGGEKVNTAFLQELPSNWWKPTSKTGDSYMGVSFNFAYFWTPGTSVEQYPPSFQRFYKELMGYTINDITGNRIDMDKVKKDNPKGASVEYTEGAYFYWHELPPDETFVFSSDESHVWISPSFAGLFLQTQDLSSYQLLQQQLTSIPLNSMVLAEIPFHENQTSKSGGFTNDLRLSDGMVSGFTNLFQSLAPAGTGIAPMPFQNMEHISFPNVPDGNKVYSEALQQLISTASINGLQSTSDKPSVAQIKSSQLIEGRLADSIYDQFMNCVNIIFEKKLGLKFCWKWQMFGTIFTKQDDIASLEKGLSLGMSWLLPKYNAMHDMDNEDVMCLADYVSASNLYSKMSPLQSSFQSSSKTDSKNGRPSVDNPDNDNTASSQESGLNTGDSKSFSAITCKQCGESNVDGYEDFCSLECMADFASDNE